MKNKLTKQKRKTRISKVITMNSTYKYADWNAWYLFYGWQQKNNSLMLCIRQKPPVGVGVAEFSLLRKWLSGLNCSHGDGGACCGANIGTKETECTSTLVGMSCEQLNNGSFNWIKYSNRGCKMMLCNYDVIIFFLYSHTQWCSTQNTALPDRWNSWNSPLNGVSWRNMPISQWNYSCSKSLIIFHGYVHKQYLFYAADSDIFLAVNIHVSVRMIQRSKNMKSISNATSPLCTTRVTKHNYKRISFLKQTIHKLGNTINEFLYK